MAQHLLQGLAVLLIDAEQEEGQHQADHQQRRRFISDAVPCEDIGGNADQTTRAEANELALGQVERHLRFHTGEVFRDRDKGHYLTSRSFGFVAGWSPGTGFAANLLNFSDFSRVHAHQFSIKISHVFVQQSVQCFYRGLVLRS